MAVHNIRSVHTPTVLSIFVVRDVGDYGMEDGVLVLDIQARQAFCHMHAMHTRYSKRARIEVLHLLPRLYCGPSLTTEHD